MEGLGLGLHVHELCDAPHTAGDNLRETIDDLLIFFIRV